jgi:hypothetical protein
MFNLLMILPIYIANSFALHRIRIHSGKRVLCCSLSDTTVIVAFTPTNFQLRIFRTIDDVTIVNINWGLVIFRKCLNLELWKCVVEVWLQAAHLIGLVYIISNLFTKTIKCILRQPLSPKIGDGKKTGNIGDFKNDQLTIEMSGACFYKIYIVTDIM